MALAYVDEDLALSLGLASVPRCVVRWFGRGRTSVAKRPASNVGQRVLPNVTVPTQGTSHTARNRYTQEVWGKIFHAGERAGKSTPCADGGEAVQWDLDACRRLLLTIANEDLKERLENSPWMLHGGEAPPHINWLKEAGVAFAIPLRTATKHASRNQSSWKRSWQPSGQPGLCSLASRASMQPKTKLEGRTGS